MTATPLARRPWAKVLAMMAAGTLTALVACKDTNVPFLTAPTSVANSPAGIDNAVIGLIGAMRIDLPQGISGFLVATGAAMARDGAVFTNTEPRTVTYPLGISAIPATSGLVWAQEYQNIRQAIQILATIPKVTPAYTAAQGAAVAGVVQTLEAYNYMMIAEAHDTLGMAIQQATVGSSPPPAVCFKNGWAYIVALLDSAEQNLNLAGPIPVPIKLPPGFSGVTATAGPANVAGSFGSFNRALAAKARLELAYAVARSPSGGAAAPTPTSPGAPDIGALDSALVALDSSGMYDSTGAALRPDVVPFTPSAQAVMFDFGTASDDQQSPVFAQLGTIAVLKDFVADVDTAHDLRWKAKFGPNPNPVQQQLYNPVASKFIPIMYESPSAPVPIVREVQLALWNAEILIGLGQYTAAYKFINNVRTAVGGLAPLAPVNDYVTVRNAFMKEQRISTAWEASVDRTIAIRMYGMAAVSDTTWEHEDPAVTTGDLHTTINPIPFSELSGRGGSFTTTCQ